MKVIRFKVGVSPYQAGELAGFPEAEARCLIEAGVAEEYQPQTDETKAPERPEEDKMVRDARKK
jgi:hypothetical protein